MDERGVSRDYDDDLRVVDDWKIIGESDGRRVTGYSDEDLQPVDDK